METREYGDHRMFLVRKLAPRRGRDLSEFRCTLCGKSGVWVHGILSDPDVPPTDFSVLGSCPENPITDGLDVLQTCEALNQAKSQDLIDIRVVDMND